MLGCVARNQRSHEVMFYLCILVSETPAVKKQAGRKSSTDCIEVYDTQDTKEKIQTICPERSDNNSVISSTQQCLGYRSVAITF